MNINLREFGVNFNSRMLADSIFKSLTTTDDSLIIDFSEVEEATPSFCHEMLTVLMDKKKEIKIINTNDSIKLQLNKAISAIGKNPLQESIK